MFNCTKAKSVGKIEVRTYFSANEHENVQSN